MADVRHSVNHIEKQGVVYIWRAMDDLPYKILIDFNRLYNDWVSGKKGLRLTFSLNFFPLPPEPKAYILSVYSANKKLWAAYTFFPYKSGKAMALDIMARSDDAPNGITEAAIVEAIRHFKGLGMGEVSLGTAPLASVEDEKGNILEKGREFIFNKFNALYNYKSLFSFKNEFAPEWQHRYLAYEKNSDISKIVPALIGVHLRRK